MKQFKSIVMAAIVTLVLGIAVAPTESATAVDGSSSALSIVPKKNYIIEPGKSVKDTLVIRNIDPNMKLDLTLRVVDFTYTDDGGTPKFMLDPKAEQTTWSLKPFLEVQEKVIVPAGGSATIPMKVSIPAGHGAGSYYSAIMYQSGSGEGGNVGLSASGVTLVFTTIPGKVHEELLLEKFGPYDKYTRKYHPFFTVAEPQVMAYTLKNNSNVTQAPVGSITLRSMFGKEYKIDDVNPARSLALIGQTRTFNACIKSEEQQLKLQDSNVTAATCISAGLWPGYYSTSIDLFYGQNGNTTKEIVKSGGFWYLPWWFIAVCLVVLATATFFIWKLVRKIRHALYGPQGKSKHKTQRRK